ncbi:MAG: hypothetical protein AAF363_18265 [Bacteroidota bacterium]
MIFLRLAILILFFSLGTTGLIAQNSKESGTNSREYTRTFDPESEKSTVKSGKAQKKYKKVLEEKYGRLEKEYVQRMRKVRKQKKKEARLSEKPQYSDPLYFGHKKKPKIRPVGKRKFCKECHIVH